MIKFIKIWIFLIYIIPFTLALKIEFLFNYILVLITLISFYIGSSILPAKKSFPINYNQWLQPSLFQLFFLFFCFVVFRYTTVFDVFTHLFVGDYLQWSLSNAISRYKGNEEDQSFLYQLGTISMFTYSILLGSIYFKNAKYLIISYLGLAFILLIESSTLGRAGTLICIIAIISELVIRKNHLLQKMSIKKIFKILSSIILLFLIIFLYSAYNRLDANDDGKEIILQKFGEYIIGPYQAFFIWLQNPNSQNIPTLPLYNLFTSFYKILGIKVEQGFYPLVNTDFGETNIYTVLRSFYSDLGWFLSSLLFLFFGIFMKYKTYNQMNINEYFIIKIFINILIFTVLSPFYFTTFFAASLLSIFMLLIQKLNFFKINN